VEAVTLTIDEQTLSARIGKTILEVAREHGIFVPTLCHHDYLRPIGACRLCQVELVDKGMVVPACVTKVAEGMNIATNSERVLRNRRNIIRLLMSAHPESCLVCEKGNTCELRHLAAQLGVGQHGLDSMPYHPQVMDLNPLMGRDLSKCILCAKCLRADQELVCEGVIDYNQRGFDAHPATLFSQPLEGGDCTFCGTCLNVCPTGAIFEKNKVRLDHGGGSQVSVCSFCACGCSILLEHNHSQVVGVRPSASAYAANGVTLCVKGHFGYDHLASPQRLSTPLIKTADGFKPVSWDEALQTVASGLSGIAKENGPQALGFVGGVRSTNEENYLFQKLARQVLGTANLDSTARTYWTPAAEVLHQATGFAAATCTFKDVEAAQVIFLIGADPTQTAPVLGYHLKRALKAGAKLILTDPLQTKLAPLAQIHLKPLAGTDLHLLAGITKAILDSGLVDHKFAGAKTRGLDQLESVFSKVSLADCAKKSGTTQTAINKSARLLAQAANACLILGGGVLGQPAAKDIVKLIVDLALLTGNLGRAGAGIIPLLKDCNTQGSLDMGVSPGFLPGHRKVGEAQSSQALKGIWGKAPPPEPGWGYFQMLLAARKGRLKGMYVLAENPLGILPHRQAISEALGNLSFLVVQDMFMSETAQMADVVLPAAGLAEKEGTLTNLERRVQKISPAVMPPGDFAPEWKVLTRLASLLGADWDYSAPEQIFAEIEQAVPLYRDIASILAKRQAALWPLPGNESVVDTLPHGIGLPGGKAQLPLPELKDRPGAPKEKGFPYLLMHGHVLQHLGSGLRTSHSPRLNRAAPQGWLGMSSQDMTKLELDDGAEVMVRSSSGSLRAPVRCDSRLPKGMLFMPVSFPDLAHNALLSHNWRDPKSPGLKYCRVSLRKA
jgi:formate dehydrogenase alpha subunit